MRATGIGLPHIPPRAHPEYLPTVGPSGLILDAGGLFDPREKREEEHRDTQRLHRVTQRKRILSSLCETLCSSV
jgi:hypothetical protein